MLKNNVLENYFNKIKAAYEKNLFYLPLDELGHFFERLYKVTGDKKYLNILSYYFYINKVPALKKSLFKLRNKTYSLNQPKKLPRNSRARIRRTLYKKRPEIEFFNCLFIDLLFAKITHLDKGVLRKEIPEIIKLLKKIDFEKIYLNKEAVIRDNSFTFNSAFILKYLGIQDFTDKILALFKLIYFDDKMRLKKPVLRYEYLSLIYSMTHIIISDSGFYERFVRKHHWIIDYFAKNLDEIVKKVTPDILSEVGLCFRLCKKEAFYPKAFKQTLNYLLKVVDFTKLNNKHYVIKKEHTNSILLLLFNKKFKLHPGPNLSKHSFLKD